MRQAMLHQVAVRPELVFEMTSREFEQFAAELFERQGFEVELTKATRDGGKNLYVARSDVMGSFRYAVEYKRYAPDYPVRVDLIHHLHAVVDLENLTAGMVLITSRLTRDARAEAPKIAYSMTDAEPFIMPIYTRREEALERLMSSVSRQWAGAPRTLGRTKQRPRPQDRLTRMEPSGFILRICDKAAGP